MKSAATAARTTPILIALGANLVGPNGAPPLHTCQRAAVALDALPGLRLAALSRWHVTAPDPPSDQPPYINAVALLHGPVGDPAALLAALHRIEATAGRRRSVPNAARSLDLDIIAIGDLVRAAPDPVLPHPRAHLRDFVLLPLAEVAPAWVHPALGLSVSALIAALPARPFGSEREKQSNL
ncbi:MAG TPA: 2-amino-4-hydroxy-6-hydroxymethyldihydropteridine diphosphokinase [Acetobacteraceae bacterium]|nr:2-amino-4-hydroxy-6-hydroxymethyldihydropteridine diphosphokinase [Acetobacteraceae bacterium]